VYSKETITPARVTKRFKRSHPNPKRPSADVLSVIAARQAKDSLDTARTLETVALTAPLTNNDLGIPKNLMTTLVDVYFRHVYNAGLLLHRDSFLSSIADGTANPHIMLSVCAWAAKYIHLSID